MQRLTLTVTVGDFVPGEAFHVYGDADDDGLPTGSVNYTKPITGKVPVDFWPLVPPLKGWGEGPWGDEPWGGGIDTEPQPEGWGEQPWGEGPWGGEEGTSTNHSIVTPPLYFGWFLFVVKTFDEVGNACSGEPVEFRAFVNSGPECVSKFRQTGVEDGRPVFGFTPPDQMVA